MTCLSIIGSSTRSTAGTTPAGQRATFAGYGPADLQKAYHLTAAAARKEHGKTVAIVDAFSDPRAAVDLARYRKKFHLPPCTVASGCLRIVNQKGNRAPLPIPDGGWGAEESLDLDMVSAICPQCRILLVEANNSNADDLGVAVNRAVTMGARYVSNSWGGPESFGSEPLDHFFNHPGVAVSFAAGDSGYGPSYPASLQFVTAVGGTALSRSKNKRGFTESAWGSPTRGEGTGSGCSDSQAKPSWQRSDDTEPTGCLNRTEDDVAAVADPKTGVFVFDTFEEQGHLVAGGTSVAAPIITSIYALAGTPTPGTYPAEYPYLHPEPLIDVTQGTNGQCEPNRQYLCNARSGYDGPTGLGTPDGPSAFTDHGAHRVTVVDPGTVDVRAGESFSLRITTLDSRAASPPPVLRYSTTGLPPGLALHQLPHSTDAMITGTLPSAPGTFHVTITARDGQTTGTTRFMIVTLPSLTASTGTPGEVSLVDPDPGVNCLDAGTGGSGSVVKISSCDSGSSGQQWLFTADGGPDDSGQLTTGGFCLSLPSRQGQAVLAACDGSASERWGWQASTVLSNLSTGTCLTGNGAGSPVLGRACLTSRGQAWALPAGQIITGAGPLCLDNPGNAATGTRPATVAGCGNSAEQQWTFSHGIIPSAGGGCLTAKSTLADTPVVIASCRFGAGPGQDWRAFGPGELINLSDNLCLADPAGGGTGTTLTQEHCDGQPGEIWGLN
jgi:hypothetical protein